MDFFAVPTDADGALRELSAQSLSNPFSTPEFFTAMQRCGYQPWVLGLREGERLISACGAFLKSGRLNRDLEIVSLTEAARDDQFWSGLLQFCSRERVTEVEIGTYGSPRVAIPSLPGEVERKNRWEFVLDLRVDNLGDRVCPSHKRNIRKAERAGLTVVRTRSQAALAEHLRMKQSSMERRRNRGEDVPGGVDPQEASALLESTAGDLYQVVCDGEVLSSVLVLRSPMGACTHSSGTSPAGMKTGASHFLRYEIASQLKAEGLDVFNLGGASEGSGLAQFKAGFGCEVVRVSQVVCRVGPAWRRKVATVARMVKQDRAALLRMVTGNVFRWIIYSAYLDETLVPESRPGLEFRALTEDDLHGLPTEDQLRDRCLKHLAHFGGNYAYGVFVEGRIAHVNWLLPPSALSDEKRRVFPLREDEVEIAAAETLPEFRGRGLMGFAARNLFAVARAQGIRRVFARVATANKASHAGLGKTAFRRVGWAVVITAPLMHGRQFVWRLYR